MNNRPRRLLRTIGFALHRVSDRSMFAIGVALALLGTAWSFADSGAVRVPSVAIIIMVLGSLVLSGRAMIALVVLLAGCVLVVLVYHDAVSTQLSYSGGVMLVSVAIVSIVQTARRDALGLRRMSAESVLEGIGAQLRAQGRIPVLPKGWNVDVAQHAAFGAPFSGDFVSCRVSDADGAAMLDLVLVDVSGRGIEAGARALLFSGAIGGLLGEVSPDRFLGSANEYLMRQHVDASFSTATYVQLNLATGAYEIRSAGHPPAIVWSAASRQCRRAASSGIVLGVVDELDLEAERGVLSGGDALVLYTDGVVEMRSTDLETGIASLEQSLVRTQRARRPSRTLAGDLLAAAPGNEDDQTVVVIWADGPAVSAAIPGARGGTNISG